MRVVLVLCHLWWGCSPTPWGCAPHCRLPVMGVLALFAGALRERRRS
ncbi:hypothetical protein QJS66_12525 [Kocuria rhizophila]|nr:hypothetical protein QJS66_12525 [Kocuria rhizophila]